MDDIQKVPAFQYYSDLRILCPYCGMTHIKRGNSFRSPCTHQVNELKLVVHKKAMPKDMQTLGNTIKRYKIWLKGKALLNPNNLSTIKRTEQLPLLTMKVKELNAKWLEL